MGNEVEDGKVCALLAYLFVGIIWYFADEKMKKNAFAKYHVKQGIGLLILWVIIWVLSIFIGGFLWLLIPLLELGIAVLAILGIINALNGKKAELPIANIFASKFNF